MAIFFVYVHDGGAYSNEDIEYSPNAGSVKRELASRVRTGTGKARFVKQMAEADDKAAAIVAVDEEWPPATDEAHMLVWRCKTKDLPSGTPTEVWKFSGKADRPRVIPVS